MAFFYYFEVVALQPMLLPWIEPYPALNLVVMSDVLT